MMDKRYQAQMLQDHVLRIQTNPLFGEGDSRLAEAKRHLEQVWLMLDAYRKRPPRRVIVVDGGTVIGKGVVTAMNGEMACVRMEGGETLRLDTNQVDLIEDVEG
jgi:hypothetical protein